MRLPSRGLIPARLLEWYCNERALLYVLLRFTLVGGIAMLIGLCVAGRSS